MKKQTIEIKYLIQDKYEMEQKTVGSAGFDLKAMLPNGCIKLKYGQTALLHTGVSIHINDPQYTGLVVLRSGVASTGLMLSNGVGVIDSDYQGEIKLHIRNIAPATEKTIIDGDRIAQIIFSKIVPPQHFNIKEVKQFSTSTQRGHGGFGSTGNQ